MTHSENKKYQQIVAIAGQLFFKYGIKRVSIEEICSESNVSKMTFYKFFKNKNDLAIHILQTLINDSINKYNEIIEMKIPFIEKLRRIILFKLHASEKIGNDFMNEILETNSEVASFISKKIEETKEFNLQFLRKGQNEGVFRKTITPEMFNYLLDQIMEMFNGEKLKKLIPDFHIRLEELTNYFFYGISDFEKG